jgi:putative hemolysin
VVNIHEPVGSVGAFERWPVLAVSGALEVRLAETEPEVAAAQRLRYRVFYEEMSAIPSPSMRDHRRDFDKFDAFCDHMLVIDRSASDEDGQPAVVGTYRLMRDVDAARAGGFYTGGEYDISPLLSAVPAGTRLLELGRSCVLKSYRAKPMTMQLLWRGVMAYVARFSIDTMFGCASLPGIDPDALALPLSFLYHAARRSPVRALPELYVDMNRMPKEAIDTKEALRALPPLVKGYVRAGAGIGDGAVIDRQFGTIDVFIDFPVSTIDARYRHRFGIER